MNIPNPYPEEEMWFRRIAEAPSLEESLQLIADEIIPFLTEQERHNICNTPRSKLSQAFHFTFALWIRNRYFFRGPQLCTKFNSQSRHFFADSQSNAVIEILWERLRKENGGRPYLGEAFDPECLDEEARTAILTRAKDGDPQGMLEQAMCCFYDSSEAFSLNPEENAVCKKRRRKLYCEALRWLQRAESCDGYPRAEFFAGVLQSRYYWHRVELRHPREHDFKLSSAVCRKSALEWLQLAAADGIELAHRHIADLQREKESEMIPGSWRLFKQVRILFRELNRSNPFYVSPARHYLNACNVFDDHARRQLEWMVKEQELTQELTDAEMEEFASVSEHWVTGYHAPPPGTVEERFICDHVTIEESLVRDVFRLKSHRGRPLIFEPFCSCDPQFAPPEIVALYPVRKR